MKIQTSSGEVDLTAEMVVRGMVLADAKGDVAVLMDRFVDYACMWSVKGWALDESTPPLAPCWVACLGCDPTIASRADCERFGVHGDAGAHGFARLRGGGAVDIRRVWQPAGAVMCQSEGLRLDAMPHSRGPLTPAERFVGLDARYASPADVERLCCGEHRRDVHEGSLRDALCTLAIGDHDHHEDLATGARWQGKWREHTPGAETGVVRAAALAHAQKTFADRDQRASVERMGPVGSEPEPGTPEWIRTVVRAAGYECRVERAFRGPGTVGVFVAGAPMARLQGLRREIQNGMPGDVDVMVLRDGEPKPGTNAFAEREVAALWRMYPRVAAEIERAARKRGIHVGDVNDAMCDDDRGTKEKPNCARCGHPCPTGLGALESGLGGARVSVCSLLCGHVLTARYADVTRPSPAAPSMPSPTFRGMPFPGEAATRGPLCPSCGGQRCFSCSQVAGAFCRFLAGLTRWAASPEGQRAQREAPLLALVAAVPEGLDPIGWRAAALATSERFARIEEGDRPCPEDWGGRLATMVRARVGGAAEGYALAEAKARNGTAMAVALLCGSRGYFSALAPHKAPPPERKQRLTVDDGRDG